MKIALLTCQKLPNLLESDQFLIPALAEKNIVAIPEIWDDENVNWSEYHYLIFRNTWDYYEKEASLNAWLLKIQILGIKTLNPLPVIQQNKHKFYLRDLQNLGFDIIPTLFLDKTETLNLSEIIPKSWKKAVIKPAFSGGSFQTKVFDVVDIEEINIEYRQIANQKELLLQEFVPEIQTVGETSFIFFNKKFSHCVNKKPIDGDFRVQSQFGGHYTLIAPNVEFIHQALDIVNSFPENLLYARVDGIIINNQLQLMEVECIEPDLYFDLAPGSKEFFVDELLQLIL